MARANDSVVKCAGKGNPQEETPGNPPATGRASIGRSNVPEWSVRGAGYTSTGNASTTRNATSAPTTAPTARRL
ncbi:hypothetical protein PMO31116_04190 [Pandoraea morbifera]|uniref:Uncharacterized protein n=1 Tax=Pandoraea morbifera TaxID=2508300 RepID=A0A5E4Y1W5_9BURK|nr:hypothetical protein PMO31116_04190 [Pandoraea morbifera]